jgi:hypothetical protein
MSPNLSGPNPSVVMMGRESLKSCCEALQALVREVRVEKLIGEDRALPVHVPYVRQLDNRIRGHVAAPSHQENGLRRQRHVTSAVLLRKPWSP